MKATELLNEQTNASETDKQSSTSEQLVKRKQIGDTPFYYVELENEKFIALGMCKLHMVENLQEAEDIVYSITPNWNFMVNVISAINHIDKQLNNN